MSTMKSTKQTMGQYEQEETVSVESERNLGVGVGQQFVSSEDMKSLLSSQPEALASCHRAFPHPGAHSRSIFQEYFPCLSWLAPFLHSCPGLTSVDSAHFTALSG